MKDNYFMVDNVEYVETLRQQLEYTRMVFGSCRLNSPTVVSGKHSRYASSMAEAHIRGREANRFKHPMKILKLAYVLR